MFIREFLGNAKCMKLALVPRIKQSSNLRRSLIEQQMKHKYRNVASVHKHKLIGTHQHLRQLFQRCEQIDGVSRKVGFRIPFRGW